MIPERTKDAINRYVADHCHTGGFLEAVLSNNLRQSFARSDKENRLALFEIVTYCWNEIPFICWGTPEKVQAWLAVGPQT